MISMAKQKTGFETGMDDFFNAAMAVHTAKANFDNAAPEFFDIANEELTLAQKKFDLMAKKMKLLSTPN